MPGGKIAIYDGLIADMESAVIHGFDSTVTIEDKIAAVLGHEIAHAAIGHTRQSTQIQSLLQGLFSVIDQFFGDFLEKHKDLYKILNEQSIKFSMLSFSREHEYEADRFGMLFMEKAGYDPKAAIWLQHYFKLRKVESFHSNKGMSETISEWFSTHPSSNNRLEANKKTLKDLEEKKFSI